MYLAHYINKKTGIKGRLRRNGIYLLREKAYLCTEQSHTAATKRGKLLMIANLNFSYKTERIYRNEKTIVACFRPSSFVAADGAGRTSATCSGACCRPNEVGLPLLLL